MENIDRRNFLKSSALLGLAALSWKTGLGAKNMRNLLQPYPDIAEIIGTGIFENTIKAVDALGGIGRFVKAGQRVGLLINSGFEIPGTYVHPEISLAAIKMSIQAGAGKITALQYIDPAYWQRTPRFDEFSYLVDKFENNPQNQFPGKIENGGFINKEIPGAQVLQQAEITEKLFGIDVMINISIGKHHATALYTGALKNTMGINTRATNVKFHLNGPAKNDPTYLAQCIADINRYRPSDLSIIDCTSFITTGGPGGPGEVIEPGKIIAGTNMVALDALACSYHGLTMTEVPTLVEAQKAGLGNMDYTQLVIYRG